jgi:hypothetical protein
MAASITATLVQTRCLGPRLLAACLRAHRDRRGKQVAPRAIDLRRRKHRGDPNTQRAPQPATRRHRVVAIMSADPGRGWTGKELAERLQIKPHNMLTQLAEWTRLCFLARTSAGTYTLATPSP